ncbi:hypothetical protein CDL15_Pgr013898 [Punica granatum]|uniref:Alpha/beta hydrolase fold-3 domain-containing protein n=3 Tax=Punica granatum TaxID=22663 RepID=A0A218W991_PUNGR|nr:hypothetical protein CDL15_Pgr013898 [Punica granatum]
MMPDPSNISSEVTGFGSSDPLAALPWTTRAAASIIFKIQNSACHADVTINRRLLKLLDLKAPPTPNPVDGISSSDFTVNTNRNLWFRAFSPTSSGPLPVIIYLHGGGFSTMSAASWPYDTFCRRLIGEVPALIVIASVEYRHLWEHRFPCQYDDGFDALRSIAENSATVLSRNADVSRCFLARDSAGGNLAHHVAVRAAQSRIEQVKIRGLIPIQPFFGGQSGQSEIRNENAPILNVSQMDWLWWAFLPEGADRDHAAANVSGPSAVDTSVLAELPATIVFAGGIDPLRDWLVKYYEWLKRSGKEAELVRYPDMVHGFYAFPELP